MRDRSLRLHSRARVGRMVVLACAAACLCAILYSVSFALTSAAKGAVVVCARSHAPSHEHKELYVPKNGKCKPGDHRMVWAKPNGHGVRILCVGHGPPDGDSPRDKTELYVRNQNHKCQPRDKELLLSAVGPVGH